MFQPGRATESWRTTSVRERLNAEDRLADGPGLKPRRSGLFKQDHRSARREAAAETGLAAEHFPFDPPFTVDDAEAEDF